MIREGFRFEEHVAFEEKLAKLERNETQMDGKQRERYARALEKLRKEICENALRLRVSQTAFIILGEDENTPLVSEALSMAAAQRSAMGLSSGVKPARGGRASPMSGPPCRRRTSLIMAYMLPFPPQSL